MEEIKISLVQMEQSATNILAISDALNEVLNDISNEIISLQSFWQSEASTTTKEKFIQFSNRFPEYKETVDNYAQFLLSTSEAYRNVETTINANASSLG